MKHSYRSIIDTISKTASTIASLNELVEDAYTLMGRDLPESEMAPIEPGTNLPLAANASEMAGDLVVTLQNCRDDMRHMVDGLRKTLGVFNDLGSDLISIINTLQEISGKTQAIYGESISNGQFPLQSTDFSTNPSPDSLNELMPVIELVPMIQGYLVQLATIMDNEFPPKKKAEAHIDADGDDEDFDDFDDGDSSQGLAAKLVKPKAAPIPKPFIKPAKKSKAKATVS